MTNPFSQIAARIAAYDTELDAATDRIGKEIAALERHRAEVIAYAKEQGSFAKTARDSCESPARAIRALLSRGVPDAVDDSEPDPPAAATGLRLHPLPGGDEDRDEAA